MVKKDASHLTGSTLGDKKILRRFCAKVKLSSDSIFVFLG